ncbi:TonB-dependent receptor domain-containing protein [Thiomicrorhabdus sp. Milos-T2]|uniref:TonB-dependent receptor domain-containing protein n=1 Tax=Thiomicrorhabdus sp. Milos-T2 TaxID=90814 RepID=UPI0004949FC8|nr:TonB-dependent receptor [Thiomicrorhabdus sp. Milos-T2]
MFKPNKITLAVFSVCLTPNYAFATDLTPIEVTTSQEEAQQKTVEAKKILQAGNSETGTTLRKISGVEASRMGGHGVDLVIRGQKETQLNILIDGAKIEGGCPNRMDPPTAYAEMSSFDDVTVIKGVNSVTYGTGGTGGTVLFERNMPAFEDGKPYNGEINLGTSNNGLTQDMNATVSAGGDKGYIVLQGSKKSADNYTDGNGDEVRSSYDSRQGHIDLGWTPNDNNELRLSYENTRTEDALFQDAKMDAPLSDGSTTRLRYKGTDLTENIQALDIDLYHSDVDHVMNNYSFRPDTTLANRKETLTDVQSKGAKIKLTSMLGHTQLDYGVQFEGVDKMATLYNANTNTALFDMWPNVSSETRSAFLESTSLFKNNQKVIMGLRYDNYTANADDTNKNYYRAVYKNYSEKTEVDQSNINALLRYERKYDNNINVFAALSRTHRYADATELFIAKGTSWTGNPDLKPEQHNQFDIGLSQSSNKTTWSASIFYDSVNNYILKDKGSNQTASLNTAGTNTVYLNKDATISGLDISAETKANQHLTLGGNASLTHGTNETDNRNLTGMSPFNGNLYAEYAANSWNTGARFNFATAQDEVNSEFNEDETPAWSTVDLYAGYKVNKTIVLTAGVDNLFDHAYFTHVNRYDPTQGDIYKVYEPGRIVWAKLNAKF